MPTWSQLTLDPPPEARAALQDHWGWLLGSGWTLLLCSVLGDVFVELPAGSVWWLSTATADLEQVAPSREAFEASLHTEQVQAWLLPGLVEVLRRQGKRCAPGECYGYTVLPVLDPEGFRAENLTPVPAARHFEASGRQHRALRRLPPGAPCTVLLDA